jgi:hypothetical protein
MGRRDRRKLEKRLRRIVQHLLKWQVQPELRGRSWRNSLVEQRRQAEKLLKESPSLRPQLAELRSLPGCHAGRRQRDRATAADFPRRLPLLIEQILDPA